VRSAEPAKGISSVVAFHEKAGRSQGGPSVATLSKFQKHNPVANPNPGDFEPDGTWYSMVEAYGGLFAIEPNHGELDAIWPVDSSKESWTFREYKVTSCLPLWLSMMETFSSKTWTHSLSRMARRKS
jgi:hypothetical protein